MLKTTRATQLGMRMKMGEKPENEELDQPSCQPMSIHEAGERGFPALASISIRWLPRQLPCHCLVTASDLLTLLNSGS
jgi:hypothetical protein